MGSFKLGKMTLRSLVGRPATVRYPFEKREPYPAMRGHLVNDMDTCILCGMCQRACPVGAIEVDRKAGDWTVDPYRCIQCAHCTRECPKNCLSMSVECSPATHELTVTRLHKDMPAKPAAGAAAAKAARPKPKLTPEQEARVAAARERAAAKKAAAAQAQAEAASDARAQEDAEPAAKGVE